MRITVFPVANSVNSLLGVRELVILTVNFPVKCEFHLIYEKIDGVFPFKVGRVPTISTGKSLCTPTPITDDLLLAVSSDT